MDLNSIISSLTGNNLIEEISKKFKIDPKPWFMCFGFYLFRVKCKFAFEAPIFHFQMQKWSKKPIFAFSSV